MITKLYIAPTYHNASGGPYNFFFESSGLESVEIFEIDESEVRTLVPLQNYKIDFFGQEPLWNHGTVTFTQPHPEGTDSIEIGRNTRITQLVDFRTVGRFEPNIVELAADKAMMICQEIAARKCTDVDGTPQTTVMTQLINFYSYGLMTASAIEFLLDNLTQIIIEIGAAKEDCRDEAL